MNNNTTSSITTSTTDDNNNNNSNNSSSSYTFPTTKSKHIIDTQTTDLQTATELECKPFFIDLPSLNKGQLDHLRNTGLLPPLPNDNDGSGIGRRSKASKLLGVCDEEERPKIELLNDNESSTTDNGSISNKSTTQETSSSTFDPYAIRLIRKAHISYLLKALTNPLSRGFVSLDASHTWMVYWCLHSLDLMGYFDTTTSECSTEDEGGGLKMNDDALKEIEVLQKADLLQRIVSTLEYCWTDVTLELSIEDVVNDVRLKQLFDEQQQQQTEAEDTSTEKKVTITGGGFGGGNQQIPHCATSYAAVLSLSIVASLGLQQQSSSHPYYQAGKLALNVLKSKRLQMYAFFLTLRESIVSETDNEEEEEGKRIAFRMQHDGEIDVRASYCLLAPCYLLGLLNNNDQNNPLLSPAISRYIASCQTFEGGFGAEPFNEAHGGYTFCSLAALRILDSVTLIDVNALSSWLARRQMGYEGGFCGRTNKLVDGCYSFWQGGAVAVLDGWFGDTNDDEVAEDEDENGSSKKHQLSYDELMLQRYILLCAQDVNGGLRDKPSKPKDFYHSCYNLSGLSVAQHALESWPSVSSCDGAESFNNLFGDVSVNIIGRTDPVINIRKERVQFMLAKFT